MLRRFYTYLLAVLVLLTNVGIPVYTHVCRGMGQSWSSIILPTRTCCSTKTVTDKDTACHGNNCCTPGITSSPCCEDQMSLIHFEVDLPSCNAKESIADFMTSTSGSALIIDFRSLFFRTSNSFLPHAPPIPYAGKDVLRMNQSFRC